MARIENAWPIASIVALAGCFEPTPFGTNAPDSDLNAKNQARLLASENPGPLTFVALGDTHDDYDALAEAIEHINARGDVQFVLHAGDLTNLGLLQEFDWTQRALERLDAPVLVAIGNHDAISSGKEIFRELYGPFDYSFVYARKKFIVFNSNAMEFDGRAPDRAWLVAQLEDLDGADSAILLTHQSPLRPSQPDAGEAREFYAELVRDYQISLFINGHHADFELRRWLGTISLQCGTFENLRLYTVVRLDERGFSFEVCERDACRPAEPVSAEIPALESGS